MKMYISIATNIWEGGGVTYPHTSYMDHAQYAWNNYGHTRPLTQP